MWSGPRNISTAMMRSWENRSDTVVVDEPFYAYYLERTGIDHPMAERIIAEGECDWRRVVESLLAPVDGARIFFQKHMTLHLLAEVDREWLKQVRNCFLIRHPADVIASYLNKREAATVEDLGFLQQRELYRWVVEHCDREPPILDAADVRDHPREVLSALCERLEIPFEEAMLEWPAGGRASDGIWAPHWYAAVIGSTGFEPSGSSGPVGKAKPPPAGMQDVYLECLEAYEDLERFKIDPAGEKD